MCKMGYLDSINAGLQVCNSNTGQRVRWATWTVLTLGYRFVIPILDNKVNVTEGKNASILTFINKNFASPVHRPMPTDALLCT